MLGLKLVDLVEYRLPLRDGQCAYARLLLQQRQLGLVFLLGLRFQERKFLVLRDLELIGFRSKQNFLFGE